MMLSRSRSYFVLMLTACGGANGETATHGAQGPQGEQPLFSDTFTLTQPRSPKVDSLDAEIEARQHAGRVTSKWKRLSGAYDHTDAASPDQVRLAYGESDWRLYF